MTFVRAFVLSFAAVLLSFTASAQDTPAPKDAHLYFVWPTDGTVIKGAFWARFGLRNMGVTQAGSNFHHAGQSHDFRFHVALTQIAAENVWIRRSDALAL